MVIITIVVVAMIVVMVPSVFALTILPNDGLPEGHIPVLDDKIVITQHTGFNYISESARNTSTWFSADSMIYGDLVNVSEDTLYYVIIRGNVYDDGKLLDDAGHMQPYTFRYGKLLTDAGHSLEDIKNVALTISPYKIAIHPGESAQFSLWPGQVGWDCYEVWIESYELENKFKGISDEFLRNDLEIKSVKDHRGVLKGQVHNPTENSLDYTYVVVAKYDQNEKLFAMLGDDTGNIGPGESNFFELPLYLDGYPIKSQGDNFIYGEPANYEVSAWGYNAWDYGEWQGTEYDRNPVKYLGTSKFFPNKDTTFNVNVDEEIQNKESRQTSSCVKDPNQVFERSDYTKIIPDWIKNNAGWWANDDIEEKEFLSALNYLLSNEILRINIPREEFHMELDSQTYHVTKYNSAKMKLSGWYEGDFQDKIRCDLWEPGEEWATKMTITREGNPGKLPHLPYSNAGNFEQSIPLNLDWDEGRYSLECNHRSKNLATLSFDIIHGESPQVDKIIKSKVPSWIKNNAGWWADGTIDEATFLNGLEYLVQNGIIDAGRYNSKILKN